MIFDLQNSHTRCESHNVSCISLPNSSLCLIYSPRFPGIYFYFLSRNDPTLRSDLFPFLYPVETNTPETADYYSVIDRPMCFTKIESHLEELSYFSTPEIVGDIRLILENCYRFNGPTSWVSRMACKVRMALVMKFPLRNNRGGFVTKEWLCIGYWVCITVYKERRMSTVIQCTLYTQLSPEFSLSRCVVYYSSLSLSLL